MVIFRLFAFLLIFNSSFTVIKSSNEGNDCLISKTKTSGKCSLLTNCPVAIANLEKGNYPELCGFQGKIPIVCCNETPETNATTTTIEMPVPISEQKCSKYRTEIYYQCGILPMNPVVGGDLAELTEFPHMALIGYGNSSDISWECGGSLISERFVLTAAHCVQNRKKQNAQWVRLGDLNIKNDRDYTQPEEIAVIEGIRHPDYLPLLRYHDIALLKLIRNVDFNDNIKPACLQSKHDFNEKEAIATGWGNLEYTGLPSDDLMKVTLDIFDHAHCNNSYRMYISNRTLINGIIDNLQICAGGYKEVKDTCQGDSGGPLQVHNSEDYCMYNIIGVTSFGKVCGVVNSPGVYTRVSAYVPWIESIVWPNN